MHWHTTIIVSSAVSLICQEHFLTHSNFKCLKLNVPIEIHPVRVCDSSPWLWSEYAEAERGAYMNKLLRKGQGKMLNSVSPPGRVRTSALNLRGGWANGDHILFQIRSEILLWPILAVATEWACILIHNARHVCPPGAVILRVLPKESVVASTAFDGRNHKKIFC